MSAMSPKSKERAGPAGSSGNSASNGPPANVPKVLRIGIIQSGKILEERIIRKRDTVSVGNSERNTFVIATSELPNRFEMFENKGEPDYTLQFTDSMGGRISLDGEVKDLEDLRKTGQAKKKGKVYQVTLSEKARGKIVVGDSTILFQFVAPPPIQPKPQLPAAARGGVFKNIEWFVTTVWIVCFFLEFGFFSWLELADWPKPSMSDKYIQLMELVAAPEASFEKKVAEVVDGEGEGEEAEEGEEEKKPDKKKGKAKEKGPGDDGPKRSAAEVAAERAARRAALAEQLAQRGINKILGTLGGSGEGAIVDVLRGGDVGADQDELLSQVNGVGVATGGSRTLRGPAGGEGTGEAADISQLRMKGGDVAVKTAGAGKEKRVTGNIRKKKPTAVDGTGDLSPQEVAKVVNRRIGAIKGCYERALRRNPNLEGKITIRFTIAGSGKVSAARTTMNELTPDVGNCIVTAFKRFRFPQPDGGSLTVEYPFLFTPSQ
jgi:hypothetical protein